MPITNYDWDEIEDNIDEEYDAFQSTLTEYSTTCALYGHLLSQLYNSQASYFHFDGMGSATELTNSAASITDTRRYSGFGEITESSGLTQLHFAFRASAGYFFDEDLTLLFVRGRSLRARVARWLSSDPLGVSVDINEYAYVHNNPTIKVDPSGNQAEPDDLDTKIKCCTCEAAVFSATDDVIVNGVKPVIRGRTPTGATRYCLLKIDCSPKGCPRPPYPPGTIPIPGRTGTPRLPRAREPIPPELLPPPKGGIWIIDICVGCGYTSSSSQAIVDHELIHAKSFCDGNTFIDDCLACKKEEGIAYRHSCNELLSKGLIKDLQQCIRCGIYYGCRHHTAPGGGPCVRDNPKNPCDYEDIGVIKEPEPAP